MGDVARGENAMKQSQGDVALSYMHAAIVSPRYRRTKALPAREHAEIARVRLRACDSESTRP